MSAGRGKWVSLVFVILVLFSCATWYPQTLDEPNFTKPTGYELDGVQLGMSECNVRALWGELEKRFLFTGDVMLEKPGGWHPSKDRCILDRNGRVVSISGHHLRYSGSLQFSSGNAVEDQNLPGHPLQLSNHCGNVSSLSSGFAHGGVNVYLQRSFSLSHLDSGSVKESIVREVRLVDRAWEEDQHVDESVAVLQSFNDARDVCGLFIGSLERVR